MLDLKKLEEKLDKALANETAESLSTWLHGKRLKNLLQSLGEGVFENLSNYTSHQTVSKDYSEHFDVTIVSISEIEQYPIAA